MTSTPSNDTFDGDATENRINVQKNGNNGDSSFPSKLVAALGAMLNPYSEYIAELIGTMMLITIGGSSVAQNNYSCYLKLPRPEASTPSSPQVRDCVAAASNPNVHIAWGLAVMLGVYTASGRSAAHLNPAVTLSNCLFSGFGWVKGCYYMLSQLVGAFLGSIAVYIIYYGAYSVEKGLGIPTANKFVSNVATGPLFGDGLNFQMNVVHYILSEVTGTAILLIAILAISENVGKSKTVSCIAPFLIGLSVTAIGMSLGLLTGYAINPARDFGPRLAAFMFEPSVSKLTSENNYFLIPLFAPFVGAIAGTFVYKVVNPTKKTP